MNLASKSFFFDELDEFDELDVLDKYGVIFFWGNLTNLTKYIMNLASKFVFDEQGEWNDVNVFLQKSN